MTNDKVTDSQTRNQDYTSPTEENSEKIKSARSNDTLVANINNPNFIFWLSKYILAIFKFDLLLKQIEPNISWTNNNQYKVIAKNKMKGSRRMHPNRRPRIQKAVLRFNKFRNLLKALRKKAINRKKRLMVILPWAMMMPNLINNKKSYFKQSKEFLRDLATREQPAI